MIELIQEAAWPGVLAVDSVTGTVSHGTRPGAFLLTTYPQTANPAMFGDLVIGDGHRRVVLRDCKVDSMVGRAGADGQTWTLTILDRRWKWQTGRVSGRYNQLDPRGKLIPWTIRSPRELAELCLRAAGETNYVLVLPDGLTAAVGKELDRYLALGENFPQTLANPPVVWDHTPPMLALSRLAEQFGCRVIYQPALDRVLVVPPGAGLPLPDGPLESYTPSIDSPETPAAVGVAGAPVRVQMRFRLEPVAREWDGSIVPAREVSYAPEGEATRQISTVTWTCPHIPSDDPLSVKVYITYTPPGGAAEVTAAFEFGAGPYATVLADVAGAVNGDPVGALVAATAAVNVLTLTGRLGGFSFGVRAETSSPPPDALTAALVQPAQEVGGDWSACRPPNFRAVRATERLAHPEAVGLARESVYRYYRIKAVDVSTGKPPLTVPVYSAIHGPLKRRQQLILQPTKVDQVKPAPRGQGGVNRGNPGGGGFINRLLGGILPEFYNGYSRDAKAVVYGSISARVGNVLWDPPLLNTPATEKVRVEFSIDPVEQMVVFSEPVWENLPLAPGKATLSVCKFPDLVLETAVLVTDAETGAVFRWEQQLPLGGRAPTEWAVRDDIQMGVVAAYTTSHGLTGTTLPDAADATARARYYLEGMAARYRVTGGETRAYIGVWGHDPDGYCQQASYSLGPGGASTTLSGNTEHSDVIPDYFARRRDENLPPDRTAAIANLLEQAQRDAILPKVPSNPRP